MMWFLYKFIDRRALLEGVHGKESGTTASESAANQQLPGPFDSLQNITAIFTSKGLNAKDVVVLSCGHHF